MMKSCILVIITITAGLTAGDDISPNQLEYFSHQGESVTLSCNYTATSDYIFLYWYRQHSNQGPQFLLYKGARAYDGNEHNPDKQFKSNTTRVSTQLTIPSLIIADTAIYYCALRDWGSDKLTFAKGTTLTVYAKEPKISDLSLLLSPEPSQSGVCVATGGVQRDQEMTLTSNKDKPTVKTIDGAMYSLEKTNYFAAFGDGIKKCEMGDRQDSRESPENSNENNEQSLTKPTAPPCTEVNGTDTYTTHTNEGPKVNFRMLTVNSIRVLLAKAVAFDILVTVKAMFF